MPETLQELIERSLDAALDAHTCLRCNVLVADPDWCPLCGRPVGWHGPLLPSVFRGIVA